MGCERNQRQRKVQFPLTVLYQVTCWSLGHCTPRWKMKGSQTLQGSRERFEPLSGSPLSTAHCLPLGNHHLIYRHSLVCCSPPFRCQQYSNWGVSLPSTAVCVSLFLKTPLLDAGQGLSSQWAQSQICMERTAEEARM